MRRTRGVVASLVVIVLVTIACGRNGNSSGSSGVSVMTPTTPSLSVGLLSPSDVAFPPRNEPFDFRNQLEAKYRDQLRRGANQTFVNTEGDIVWTQEYLRYRVNACDHNTAVQKVFSQIDGGGVAAVCGSAPSGTVAFPPRNEPFDFRQRLEVKYRDQLRAPSTSSFVDIEGDIVWTQEYLRYRVNACDHNTAVQKVFMQIDGAGVQPVCAAPTGGGGGGGGGTPGLSASFAVQNLPCNAASAGNVSCTFAASASGGTTPYSFTWTFTNPANSQVVTANTQQTSPALGCNYSAGVTSFNLSISLLVRSADGQSRTVTGTQVINRLAGNCGV